MIDVFKYEKLINKYSKYTRFNDYSQEDLRQELYLYLLENCSEDNEKSVEECLIKCIKQIQKEYRNQPIIMLESQMHTSPDDRFSKDFDNMLDFGSEILDEVVLRKDSFRLQHPTYAKEWWEKNKDEQNKKRREKYAANPQKHIKRVKEWQENNIEYMNKYKEEHKEQRKEYLKEYYNKNKEKIDEYKKEYYKEYYNREDVKKRRKEYYHKRKEKLLLEQKNLNNLE